MKDGLAYDAAGRGVDPRSAEAHIPLREFRFKVREFRFKE
jgi:hypothetical protein